MSEIKINFSDYKASGVYFLEEDNSIVTSTAASVERIAVGFNECGPFNRPIYLSSIADCNELLGPVNRKLERKGCFTNRNIRTMLKKSPIYALNLLKTDESDVVGISALSFAANKADIDSSAQFKDMYDRTKFWIADDAALTKAMIADPSVAAPDAFHAPLFSIGNCSTKDLSVIIRKAENLTGYNVTFAEWYGSADNIPYKWINPDDFVSDYFIQVIAINGNWSSSEFSALGGDLLWGKYFDVSNGLKKEMLNKFLKLDSVNVVGNWIGCIIPDFTDKQGNCRSIDYYVNKSCNKTGLLFGVNTNALDSLELLDSSTGAYFHLDIDEDGKDASYGIDMNGYVYNSNTSAQEVKFLSYNFDIDSSTVFDVSADVSNNTFTVSTEDASKINIGDYVKNTRGLLSKITKKAYVDASTYRFTVNGKIKAKDINVYSTYRVVTNAVNNTLSSGNSSGYEDFMVLGTNEELTATASGVEIHTNLINIYTHLIPIGLKGLTISNKHLPGYDSSGGSNIEKGMEKIYSMLEDTGIRRGLLNKNEIDFRYIVDTMTGGLKAECGGKKYLSKLAMDKGHCTALINVPSMTDFALSTAPSFCDETTHLFDVKYIPEGSNPNVAYNTTYEDFSLPTEDNGSKFAGFFAPYFKYTDGNRTILVPPAADVSNTFMNKFTGGDPYRAVANLYGLITNSDIEGLEYNFDDTDRGYLEPFGINPIITRNANYYIYGDRTGYQDLDSDFNFLHTRELLNTIEIKGDAILEDYVFDYNISTTRAEIYNRLKPMLDSMKDSGALVKYEIQIDEANNTKQVIDNKFCIVDIGVWISQLMEKLVARITVNRSTDA